MKSLPFIFDRKLKKFVRLEKMYLAGGLLLNTHFDQLDLKVRIEKAATQYFLQTLALKNEYGEKYAKEEIERDLRKTSLFFGGFYWKSELLNQMIATDFVSQVR